MLLNKFPSQEEYLSFIQKNNNVIPVCAEILADMETPVSLLRKQYNNQGPVFLFESVEGGERWGRYSFLGFSAKAQIEVYKTQVKINQDGQEQIIDHQGDPLAVLKNLMDNYKPAKIDQLPRFWGGLVGYITFEMVSFFENIPNHLPEDQPLASFIIPDEIIIFDNLKNTLMAVIITFPNKKSDKNPDKKGNPEQVFKEANTRLEKLLEIVNVASVQKKESETHQKFQMTPKLSNKEFRKRVEIVKQYIKEGEVIQTVISQPFTCDAPPDIHQLYRAQRYINPSPYLFFLHLGETALVGSSPETMVRLENGVATLRPIAGTRPRGNNEQQDRILADELLSDEKERAEHLMLVDLGRNDLGRIAKTGTVQVTDLMIVERYSHVMHMVSNITCDIKSDCDVWDLLKAAFPAGTLSGAPKIRAMEIIAELETEPRGPYGGAVGYISFNGNMDMAITIRTASIQNNTLTVRAGAGIVADSDPEKERQETVNKAMAIQKALALI